MTNSEWEIMKIVWNNNDVTSKLVVDILSKKKDWSVSTIKTLLARLVEKKYLTTTKVGNKFYYSALIEEDDYLQLVVKELLTNVCSKKIGFVVQNIIKDNEMSSEDLKTIQNIVGEKIKNAPKEVLCNCIEGQCSCK